MRLGTNFTIIIAFVFFQMKSSSKTYRLILRKTKNFKTDFFVLISFLLYIKFNVKLKITQGVTTVQKNLALHITYATSNFKAVVRKNVIRFLFIVNKTVVLVIVFFNERFANTSEFHFMKWKKDVLKYILLQSKLNAFKGNLP